MNEGYWTYEDMILQVEDCIDCLKALTKQFEDISLNGILQKLQAHSMIPQAVIESLYQEQMCIHSEDKYRVKEKYNLDVLAS